MESMGVLYIPLNCV